MNDQLHKMVLLPKALEPGDTIGLFAPAGPLADNTILQKGVTLLEELGFQVKYAPNICRKEHYLAGPDSERLAEFNRLWDDPTVKALLAVRGGYGSARLLAMLDFEKIRRHPKIIIGFSDLTSLLNGLQARTSLVTYHGPMLTTLVRDGIESARSLFTAISPQAPKKISPSGLKVLRGGGCSGRLLGGNLTTLVHLIGTPYEPNWQKSIFFLEDIAEPAYKIDRMLNHLYLAKCFQKTAGIILGGFLDSSSSTIAQMELVEKRILELTEDSVPIWSQFPISHGPANQLIPLGIQAEMNSTSQTLTFLNSYLR